MERIGKKPDFSQYDGTGRSPRPEQQEFFDAIIKNWDADIIACVLPTGFGKSFVMRSIQKAVPNVRLLTVSNELVRQFNDMYPEVLKYFGAKHFERKNEFLSAKAKAAFPCFDVISNPMALYFLKKTNPDYEDADVVVLDEADQLLGLLSTITQQKFKIRNCDVFRGALDTNPYALCRYLREKADEARIVFEQEEAKRGKSVSKKLKIAYTTFTKYDMLADLIEFDRQQIAITTKKRKYFTEFTVRPLDVPVNFVRSVFGQNTKIIAMSGTLFDIDIVENFPTSRVKWIYGKSPIPAERRPIHWSPIGVEQWTPTPINQIAERIVYILNKQPELRPCLIHTAYSDARPLHERLRELGVDTLFYVDKDAKKEVLAEWQAQGGILIGAGVSTGLDLHDDLVRLQIIPRILFPNIVDDFVRRKKLQNHRWYLAHALRQVIQACGRGSRHANDYCLTVILDDRFPQIIESDLVPTYFKDAVRASASFLSLS